MLSNSSSILLFRAFHGNNLKDKSLTVIKHMQSLVNYRFSVIPPDVVDLMQRCAAINAAGKATHLVKVFEAYCQVTGTVITYLSLSSPSFLNVMKGFLGSLADQSLLVLNGTSRQRYARGFVMLLDEMRKEIPLLPSLSRMEVYPRYNQHVWEQEKQHLDAKSVRYWNGWPVQGRKEAISFIPINLIWNSHGEEFAEEIYKNYRQNAQKHLAPAHSDFNLFLLFLSQNAERWPSTSFQHPMQIKNLFIDYLLFNFKQALEVGTDIANRTRSYAKFIHTIDEAFIQSGIWTRPFAGELPRPTSASTPGSHTNLRTTADGTIVKDKLITSVPLQLTDSEAIEIIFKRILEDNQIVVKWAEKRLFSIRKKQINRDQLSLTGTPITKISRRLASINEVGENNLCATFKKFGLAYLREHANKILWQTTKDDAAKLFALPKPSDFFALQLLLTYHHPCLTESFFDNLELYDKRGNLSGFLKTDSGYQLIGYKDRKGGKLSEQKIDLTPRQAVWVRRVISLTEPLREELRNADDNAWRYLFIHCQRAICYPKKPKIFKIKPSMIDRHQQIIDEFSTISGRDENTIREFISRVSVTSLRASSGVEVYLKTNSVETMAKAIGHTGYNSSLLSSYLPEPILAFFQTRWIRIFQRGIICEAMKDSPRLLEVARFQNMEELHEFLKHHALREIPDHIRNPEHMKMADSKQRDIQHIDQADRVLISIDSGVLTALLSLKEAVCSASTPSKLCSKAIYWSNFTDLVVREIEDGYNSDLQDHLHIARKHVSASHMENLIYASTP